MALINCIPGLIEEGKIRKGDGERAQEAYRRHYKRLEQNMGAEAAAAEASRLTLDELDYDHKLKARQTFLQISAQRRIIGDLDRFTGPRHAAASAVLGSDARAPYASVEAQQKAVLGRLHARMQTVLERHSRDLLGRARDKTGLDDLVRERFGEKTGNASAAELSAAFGEAAEYGRTRFNRAGGSIAHRQDWGLPQVHDSLRVRAVPYEQWRGDILPKLDLERMIDDATGRPFTPDSIEQALSEAYQAIRSDGWTRRNAGGGGRGKLASSRAEHRFFVFKSADDWIAYHEAYGTGTAFDAMTGHLDGMARDIGLMEVLGPNPRATLKWLQDWVTKEAQTGADAAPTRGQKLLGTGNVLDMARSSEKRLQDLYDVVAGQLNSPVNEVWARRMGGTRAFLTATHLGSSMLSAITDVGFQAVTRAYNGMPIAGAVTDYLKMVKLLGGAERQRVAVRLGLIAEEAAHNAASLNRYVDGTRGPEIANRLADGVLRVSGLSPWTQNGRWAFGMEMLGMLADHRAAAHGALDPAVRSLLDRYGIGDGEWEKIRATEPYRYQGRSGTAEFLRPDDVADEALGDALLRMVLTETDYAVPAATARSRATLSFGQRPGTLGGEILRSGAMFKNFGVSMILTHGARMMQGTPFSRAKYAAGLVITTTLLGALANSLTDIKNGKDPQPLNNANAWWRAMLRGGGFGIFGDFVGGATENRFGGSFGQTMMGPVASLADDVVSGRAFSRRYIPGHSIWYLQTAFDRLIADTADEWAGVDMRLAHGRMEQRAREQGTDFWWRPGEAMPDRGPDLANAWAGERPE